MSATPKTLNYAPRPRRLRDSPRVRWSAAFVLTALLVISAIYAPAAWERFQEYRRARQQRLNDELVAAASSLKIDELKAALRAGGDPNTVDPLLSCTALIAVAKTESAGDAVAAARLLIDKGAKVDFRIRTGDPALSYAILMGKDDLALLLLEAGADPNRQFRDYHHGGAQTLLYLAVPRPRMVAALLKHGADANRMNIPGKMDPIGPTPLHVAAEALLGVDGQAALDSLRLLLQAGANPDGPDKRFTALHAILETCWGRFHPRDERIKLAEPLALEAVKLLVAAGADVNAPYFDGGHPLDLAALAPEKIRQIPAEDNAPPLTDADIASFLREIGYTPSPHQIEVLRILVSAGATSAKKE